MTLSQSSIYSRNGSSWNDRSGASCGPPKFSPTCGDATATPWSAWTSFTAATASLANVWIATFSCFSSLPVLWSQTFSSHTWCVALISSTGGGESVCLIRFSFSLTLVGAINNVIATWRRLSIAFRSGSKDLHGILYSKGSRAERDSESSFEKLLIHNSDAKDSHFNRLQYHCGTMILMQRPIWTCSLINTNLNIYFDQIV